MPLQILVINENKAFCDYLVNLLATAGHEVSCVQLYADALQAAAANRPAAIILEISTSDMGAVEMISRLQRAVETRHVPIIVISDVPELEFELLNLFDFLPQPLDTVRLAEDLEAIARGRKQSLLRQTETLGDDTYRLYYQYLLQESGLHFDRRNQKLLERGLLNRMAALKISSFEEYYHYLVLHQESRQELKKLLPFLTIGETYFFRYHAHFEALGKILAEKRSGLALGERLKLRLWSAGCSTGEEPYSLAMTVMEAIPDWKKHDISILATDIDNRALKRAREGIYSPWAMRVMEKRNLDRYFEKSGKKFRIRDEVKSLVRFAHHNLTSSPPDQEEQGRERFDAVFCRNVTIYFTIDITRQIIEKISNCLKPGGYLFLGHAETMAQISSRFERQNHDGSFYYRKKTAKSEIPTEPAPPRQPAPAKAKSRQEQAPAPVNTTAPAPASPQAVDWERLHLHARELFREENFSETARLLQDILQHRPDHTGALILYGFTLANDGRFTEALAACEAALKTDDLLPEAYFLKGLVYEMTDRLPEAGEEYRKAILLQHDFVMAHYQLAQLYARLGKKKERLRELNNSLRIVAGLKAQTTIPHSGGLTRELFMDQLNKELAKAD
ncbi:CheR family methyltransferase [Geotalea toluenoxydans]|uniref:CheR family methyltransferase n=1 Tax=Geotalea toluenoxydans TaxID=421624 RepID=UPI0006D17B50|nr:CheR family methyltransferase [Geotalea toluenoxydans]